MPRLATAIALCALLAGCAATPSPTPQATTGGAMPAGPTVISSGSGTYVSGPPGCANPIAEYQQIIDRDVETGYLNPGVYNRVTTDLGLIKDACAEGREAEANSRLAAVKRQYGYR